MGEFFGTDGIRGLANQHLTPELAFRLGRAAGHVIAEGNVDMKRNNLILIGKDTRLSSDMLEAALAAGFMSVGVNVMMLGVIPTPGVAFLISQYKAVAGAMISASHNPYPDNGIKIFNQQGYKLSEALEHEIERYLLNDQLFDHLPRPMYEGVGSYVSDIGGVELYATHLKNTVTQTFSGLKVILDCANGAASDVAPKLFQDLGAEVICISNRPNGININVDCGSTHIENVRMQVLQQHADLGLAFDGDADRLIAVDHLGNIVDGDFILTVCGADLKEQGKLVDNTIVTTVMANMGFFVAMDELHIKTFQTNVGDKYVLEEMINSGYTLGGEQSGHIIFLEYGKTGDGILTALQLTDLVARKKVALYDLCNQMKKYPQLLVNVPVTDKEKLLSNRQLIEAIQENEQKLGNKGRILVRPSGTESLIRVMAEGPDEQLLEEVVQDIVDVVMNQSGKMVE